ncbi:ATPase inhibitor subunit zeta [Allorhizobium taibaishanense]|uniref:Aldolase n=1 Tax=Allorhizobium taibaishanense TaxID=887144 RepID=A0A7W6HS63_9HYPH|nr:ATPase inhibitor subunit zeta [Allorhizobium taibaishanense]MBB4009867.1 hypothetical protein [Allorhizobium taibaishanense]
MQKTALEEHTIVDSVASANWCPKDDTAFAIRARRNILAGFWAGERLGLQGPDLARYAQAIHVEDFRLRGDEDVIGKMKQDFSEARMSVSDADLYLMLRKSHLRALAETGCTD